jgi:glycosyltransferase involved in cell wall biosynthesis
MPTTLSVLVPVYNEQFLVAASLDRLFVLQESPLLDKIEVIVVDDCSNDETPRILQQLAQELPGKSGKITWKFLHHAKNQGKGKAIQTALAEASCELSVIHDSDLEYHPRDLLKMIPLFLQENADAVFGSRFASGEYKRVLFFRHHLGNKLLTFMCNIVSDLNLSDMETCYKMIRTSLFQSIPLASNDFRFEPEITIKLAKRQAIVFEVPISYCGRTYAEGKKIHWQDGVRAILCILCHAVSDNIYKQDEHGSQTLARLSRAHRFNRWMADTIRPFVGQNVLEIGAGIGNLTQTLIPRQSYCATDINPLYLKTIANLRSNKPYLRSAYLDVEDIAQFKTPEKPFDTVICLNVIEHVEDDRKAFSNIHSLLAPNGTAIVLVPQGKWLYGSFDEMLGHKRRYTRDELKQVAEASGFQVKTIISFNRVGVVAWFLNAKLLRRKSFGLFQVLMLNWLTPIFRLLDRFLPWPPLSYIAILQKAVETEKTP